MSGEIPLPVQQAHEKHAMGQRIINLSLCTTNHPLFYRVLFSERGVWSELKVLQSWNRWALSCSESLTELLCDCLLVSALGLQIGLIVAVLLLLGLGAALFTYFYKRRWGLLLFALLLSLSYVLMCTLITYQSNYLFIPWKQLFISYKWVTFHCTVSAMRGSCHHFFCVM